MEVRSIAVGGMAKPEKTNGNASKSEQGTPSTKVNEGEGVTVSLSKEAQSSSSSALYSGGAGDLPPRQSEVSLYSGGAGDLPPRQLS